MGNTRVAGCNGKASFLTRADALRVIERRQRYLHLRGDTVRKDSKPYYHAACDGWLVTHVQPEERVQRAARRRARERWADEG